MTTIYLHTVRETYFQVGHRQERSRDRKSIVDLFVANKSELRKINKAGI